MAWKKIEVRLLLLGGLVVLAALGLTAAPTTHAGGNDFWLFVGEPSEEEGCFPPKICIDWYFTLTGEYAGSCCVQGPLPPGGRIYTNDPETHCVRGAPVL